MLKVLSYDDLPISEESAFAHLRVGDSPADRNLIIDKLEDALAIAEDYTNRLLRRQTVEILGVTNSKGWLKVPQGSEIISVEGADDWKYNQYYEFVHIDKPGVELKITAKAGYDRDNFPKAIRAAVLLILGKLYEFDSDEVPGRSIGEISMSAKSILEQWRITPYSNA